MPVRTYVKALTKLCVSLFICIEPVRLIVALQWNDIEFPFGPVNTNALVRSFHSRLHILSYFKFVLFIESPLLLCEVFQINRENQILAFKNTSEINPRVNGYHRNH